MQSIFLNIPHDSSEEVAHKYLEEAGHPTKEKAGKKYNFLPNKNKRLTKHKEIRWFCELLY